VIEAVTTFGRLYGTAFQVVDDVLDLVSRDADLGKPTGHDMAEGVYTLPVLLCLDGSSGDELRTLLSRSMDDEACSRAAAVVRTSGAIEAAVADARALAARAFQTLEELPPSPGVTGLRAASDHLVRSVEAAAAANPV
jgi:geranylgeranyl pyrophosphate synthase